jgi:predicted porin
MNSRARARLAVGIAIAASFPALAQDAAPRDSVSLYGVLDEYVGSMRRSDSPGPTTVLNSGGMTTSYWGVRGTEDLGGGLNSFFTLESFFQVDSGTSGRTVADPLFSRNAFVGLGGRFGQIGLGRQTNPMFTVTGTFNPFGVSANLSPVMLHVWSANYNRAVLGDSVWNNSVQYNSPTFAGLRASATYALGEVTNDAGVRNVNATLNYDHGSFAAVASAQQAQTGPGFGATVTKQDAQMLGLSYDFSIVKLFGQYFHTDTPAIRSKTRTGQLGLAVTAGAGRIMATVAHTGREVAGAETSRTTAGLGYDHYLSKRTDLYAVYLSDKLTSFHRQASLALGVRHRF